MPRAATEGLFRHPERLDQLEALPLVLGGWDGASGAWKVSVPKRGCWLPGSAAVSQSRGHPSARSPGSPATWAGPAGVAAGSGGVCVQVQLMTWNCNNWRGKLYLEANRDRAHRK